MSRRPGCGVRRQAKRDAAFSDSSNPLMQQKCHPQPKRRRASLAAALHSDFVNGRASFPGFPVSILDAVPGLANTAKHEH